MPPVSVQQHCTIQSYYIHDVRTSGHPKLYNLHGSYIYPVFLVSDCGGHHIFKFHTQHHQKSMEFQDLKGKKAVVTGAGAGENDLETNSNMYLYRFSYIILI